MPNENNKPSTLDQLKELGQNDTIEQVDFVEPELKEFSTANIFELDNRAAAKRKYGKRSDRKASQVIIRNFDEDMPDFTDKKPLSAPNQKKEEVEIRPVADEDLNVDATTKLDANLLSQALKSDTAIEEASVSTAPAQPAVVEPEAEKAPAVEEADVEETIVMQPVKTESILYEKEGLAHTQKLEPQPIQEAARKLAENPVDDEFVEKYDEAISYYTKESEMAPDTQYLDMDDDTMDLYEDKKKFSLNNYPKIEEYLANQSSQGYHFIRLDGNKFYFLKGEPRPYYYIFNYYRREPDDEKWQKLNQSGWVEVARIPSRKKKEAGWIILRNLQDANLNKKEVDNDEEKLRYFKKQVNSYRSTLLLIFICMVCCGVTAWLQFAMYNGYWEILGACAFIFILCLIFFVVYYKKMRQEKKRAKLLKSRIKQKKKRIQQGYTD